MSNRTSDPEIPPRAEITSAIFAGVPISKWIASRCMVAISLGKLLDPAAPAARADRTPSGPPTLRTTFISSASSGCGKITHACDTELPDLLSS